MSIARPPESQTQLTPLEATQQLLDVSVTERGQFRTCRRRWYLSTVENLERKAVDQIELWFGSGMHLALQAFYRNLHLGRPEAELDALGALANWTRVTKKRTTTSEEWTLVHQLGTGLGPGMLEHYFQFDWQSRIPLGRPLAVEGEIIDSGESRLKIARPEGYPPTAAVVRHPSGRLMVPIVDPDSKEPIRLPDGRVPHLTARIDIITERPSPRLGLWVVDHKNLSKAPSDKGLEFDDQITGYDYVAWRLTGALLRGVIFNSLIKKLPEEPRYIKPTKANPTGLSFAKDQSTTPTLYREALKLEGLMDSSGRIHSEKHAECLAALLSKGWDPFFQRQEVTRNLTQLLNFERRLLIEWNEMREAMADPLGEKLYPNPSVYICGRCPVNTICLAMEDGSDWEFIIESLYTIGPDRKAES